MATREEDFALACTAVRDAGALAMRHYAGTFRHWEKRPGDVVSEADIAIDRLLHRELLGARPDYGWLSEETEDDPGRLACRRVWVVDPIDGTRAFVRGRPEFCVSVALVEDAAPVIGCVYNPATEEFFTAQSGAGAALNGAPIHASRRPELAGTRLLASKRTFEQHHWLKAVPEAEFHQLNSIAYRMALVAAGRFDAAISLGDKSDWDIAAADLIVREAGGRCSSATGQAFAYNGPHPRHRDVIACGAALHRPLIELIARR
jgi:myo-inositol-1(or 4)-monophosphatase